MIRRLGLALALGLLLSLHAPARAQGLVPGGWGPQFGYQSFAGPGVVAFGATAGYGYGYGMPGMGYGYGYSGYGGMTPYGTGFGGMGTLNGFNNGAAYVAPPAQAANAMNPLIDSIRQTTKRRRSR